MTNRISIILLLFTFCFSVRGYAQDSSCCIVPCVGRTNFIIPFDDRYEYRINLSLKNNCTKNISMQAPGLGYEKYGAEVYFTYYKLDKGKRVEVFEPHVDINQVWYDTLHFEAQGKVRLDSVGVLDLCRIDEKGSYSFVVFYRGKNCLSKTEEIKFRIE